MPNNTAISSKSIGRELTGKGSDGSTLRVASFRGSVQPQRSVTITVDISGAGASAVDYTDEIRGIADDFIAEIRAMAAQNGIPV